MFSFLKNHPFAVEAHFEKSIVLTYAIPKEQLENLIPSCLRLDTFNDKWAFVAVALVQTNELRPKGFPKFLGNDFILIGYRIFVRYTNSAGKNLRGLYILKSETNKLKMERLGNLFTHYNYSTTDIHLDSNSYITSASSKQSNFNLVVKESTDEIALPTDSPFSNWKEARRFAGPLPFTFSCNDKTKEVTIIEGVRENWTPQVLQVLTHDFAFIKALPVQHAVLANAFIIKDIPYYWKKGKTEPWL